MPVSRETVEIEPGYRTEVSDRGAGSPLILVHGTPLDAETWDRFEPPGRRLVAYDLRAHGSASATPPATSYYQLADDLAAVLDHLGLERAEVLGHSFGGQVAMTFAARFPARVARLWIVCCRISPFPAFAAAADRIDAEGIDAVAAGSLERWFTAAELAAETPAVAYARSHLDARHAEALAAALRLIAPFELPSELRDAPFPTTMIAAERDVVGTPEVMSEGARLCGGEFRLVPDRGHMLPLTDPGLVADLVGGPTSAAGDDRGR